MLSTRFLKITGFYLVLLLLNSVFASSALAGRYVLNQTPQTISRYFGVYLQKSVIREQDGVTYSTYSYSTEQLKKLFPKLPKQAKFEITFVDNQAQTISLQPNQGEEGFTYGQSEAAKLFNYIFGYQPPIWKPAPLPLIGHEGFSDYKFCLGDGVATSFISFRLGEDMISLYYDPVCEPPYKNSQ